MAKYSNIIGDDDYLVSEVPDVPLWNETLAVMFADPKTSVSALFYLGRWWGKPTTLRQMLAFLLPGDRALYIKNYGPPQQGKVPSAAGLTMEPLGDGRIHLTFDGPMELRKQSDVARYGMGTGPTVRAEVDMIFSSTMPIWDLHATDPHEEEKDLMFPGGHMEQLGKVTGTLKFDGEVVQIDQAPTVRDHSRGVRNWSTHHSHVWINGQFPSGWGFCCFRGSIVGQPGYAMNSAALFKDGKIIGATVETEGLTHPGSDIWKPFDLILKPEGQSSIKIHVANMWNCYQLGMYEPADIYFGIPTSSADSDIATWSLEQSGEFHCDGEIGFGWVERSNRDIGVDDHWRSMCTAEKISR